MSISNDLTPKSGGLVLALDYLLKDIAPHWFVLQPFGKPDAAKERR